MLEVVGLGILFTVLQAAEKSIKALIMERGGGPWGHLVTGLVEALPEDTAAPEELVETPVDSTSITSRPVTRTASPRAILGSCTHAERLKERSPIFANW